VQITSQDIKAMSPDHINPVRGGTTAGFTSETPWTEEAEEAIKSKVLG
jgi:hypothetical protein